MLLLNYLQKKALLTSYKMLLIFLLQLKQTYIEIVKQAFHVYVKQFKTN